MATVEMATGEYYPRDGSMMEPDPLMLERLQERNPKLWDTPEYGRPNRDDTFNRLSMIETDLSQVSSSREVTGEIRRRQHESAKWIAETFATYDDPERLTKGEKGSFGFVVPVRTLSGIEVQDEDGQTVKVHDPISSEWHEQLPLTEGLHSNVIQRLVAGLPPYVVDSYQGLNEQDERGRMVCLPMFGDMQTDIRSKAARDEATRDIFVAGFEFVERLNLGTIGLGATTPGKFMQLNRGKSGREELGNGVPITTGHPATLWLIDMLIKQAMRAGHRGFDSKKMGIMGAGAMGMAFGQHAREGLGYRGEILIVDTYEFAAEKARKAIGNAQVVENIEALLADEDVKVIICAGITPVDLRHIKIPNDVLLIDDSQPPMIGSGLGALWPIGRDTTATGEITRQGFGYGHTGPASMSDVWGCELNAYATHQAAAEGIDLTLRERVKPEHIAAFAKYALKQGMAVAPFQAFGSYVQPTFLNR